MVTFTPVITSQPTVIRNLLQTQCTQQTSKDGTISLFMAHRLPENIVEEIKAQASVLIPKVGYFAKNGTDFSWTLRIMSVSNEGVVCHFVFNDYTYRTRNY